MPATAGTVQAATTGVS